MKNRLILITGASSGIGAEIARKFAKMGNKVLLLARNEKMLDEIQKQINASGGVAIAYSLDIGYHKEVIEICNTIKKENGIPDIIINNAGAGKWRFLEETDYQEIENMIAAPYLGAMFVTKAFMPEMLERDSGHIVNVTSFAAIIPFSGATSYLASRKAMVGFHEALTADLYGTNIKTSLVYFAKVKSSFWENNPNSEERIPSAQKLIPVISAEYAAEVVVRGIIKGKRKIRAPFMLKVVEFLNYLSPSITRIVMNKSGYRRNKKIQG